MVHIRSIWTCTTFSHRLRLVFTYALIRGILSWTCKHGFSIIFSIFYDFSFIYFSLGFVLVLLQDGLSAIFRVFLLSRFLTLLWYIYDPYGLVLYFPIICASFLLMRLVFFFNVLIVHRLSFAIAPWVVAYLLYFLFSYLYRISLVLRFGISFYDRIIWYLIRDSYRFQYIHFPI